MSASIEDPVVPTDICTDIRLQASCGKDNLRRLYWDVDWKKDRIGNVFFVHRKQDLFLSVYVDDIKMAGRKQNMAPMWKRLMKFVYFDEPTSFLDHVFLGCTQRACKVKESTIDQYRDMFESRISVTVTEKLPQWEKNLTQRTVAWSHDMEGHAQRCVERYCVLATKKVAIAQSSPCSDDHDFKEEELEVGELSDVCSQNSPEMLVLGSS